MAALTLSRLSQRGLGDRIDLRTGDATQLAFSDGFFDGIFMSFVLELFDTPEIPQVLAECNRVLKTGGRIGIVSLSKLGGANPMRDLYERGHDKFPSLLDCRPIYVRRSLEEAGLAVSDSELDAIWGLPVEIVIASRTDS
ncbi:MAG: class I SAM-dependent methyltransferase [Chloroflexi bacterium]|nr:class I SAM-dependent methyltransferase [Chloroflexota bacterium]